MRFIIGYVVLAQGIKIVGKKIKTVTNWHELKQFIQSFNKIVGPFTTMLSTIISLKDLLTSIDVAEENKMVGENIPNKMIKNWFKSKKR